MEKIKAVVTEHLKAATTFLFAGGGVLLLIGGVTSAVVALYKSLT